MKKMISTIFVGILLLCSFSTIASSDVITKTNEGAEWTIMILLDADNNLEEYALDDFLEMSSVGSDENVNIVVQLDRIEGYDTSYKNWNTTKRYLVEKDMRPNEANAIMDLGETNCGDPEVLIDFAQWSMENYPADKYSLILWDHGGGFRADDNSRTLPFKHVCWDDTDGDVLTLKEARYALKTITDNGASKIDLLGFDACLMGMLEVGYQFKEFADYMTASEEVEPAFGWNFDEFLGKLVKNPTAGPKKLGEYIVTTYEGETLSTTDLYICAKIANEVSVLGQKLINPDYFGRIITVVIEAYYFWDWDFVDLYNFSELILKYFEDDEDISGVAQAIMNKIKDAVTSNKYDTPDTHGISIYIPWEYYDLEYDETLFAKITKWDEFAKWFIGEIYLEHPPTVPIINGPDETKVGKSCTYNVLSFDADDDDIEYFIAFGDGNNTEWDGPYWSGETAYIEHTWEEPGDYKVQAMARDSMMMFSDWSEALEVNVTKKKSRNVLTFLEQFQMFLERWNFPVLEKILNLR